MLNIRDTWANTSQPWEREFWRSANVDRVIQYESAVHCSARLLRRFGVSPNMRASVVVDIGNGPTGRLAALRAGRMIGIDPLNDDYLAMEWPLLFHYDKLYSRPAEDTLPELVGQADVVLSWNCLDHCYDAEKVIARMAAYLRPGGLAMVSCDCDRSVFDDTHPLMLRHEEVREMLGAAGLVVEREDSRECFPGPDGVWWPSWSDPEGVACVGWHWWARRTPRC